jgi:hypothetical protein
VAREMRSQWFQKWVENNAANSPNHLLNFHKTKHGKDEKNDILMQRAGGLQTVSISQIIVENSTTTFLYTDFFSTHRFLL